MSRDLGALGPIVERKRQEVQAISCGRGAIWAKAELLPPAPGFDVLRGGRVIAELKRRSPSGGWLRPELDVPAVAAGYAAAGAAAISVLTDAADFGGSPADLTAVRAAVAVPVLRKDFTIDPVQIAEARVLGADWVLLIAAILEGRELEASLDAARRAGAGALVEVHDQAELERALVAGASCVGINNRDLRSLRSDLATFARLRPLLPSTVACVAESGVRGPADVSRLVGEGADAVLVGEALMRHPDPAALCAELVAAGREAAVR
ncbi:MAG TPA: indole-3-glycerol phosphate synthase TrpC [Candidatus Binatia bacterium]|nr:indole-3-glycerol phosphate synthase TrpC [Candidatus Binatia bacterium]